MTKTIILVIILAALIGGVIVFVTRKPAIKNQPLVESSITASPTASPIPSSTLTPSFPNNTINEQTDLSAELNKLTPNDFSGDYQQLKNQISSF